MDKPVDATEPDSPAWQIYGEQVDAHYRVSTFSVCAALTGATLLVLVVASAGALRIPLGFYWFGSMVGLGAVHIGLSRLYLRAYPVGLRWRRWAFYSTAITFAECLGWGLAPLLLVATSDRASMLLVLLTTMGVSAGAVIGYGRLQSTLLVAFITPVAPFLIYSVFSDDVILRGSVFLLLLYMVAAGHLGMSSNRGFSREIKMRMQNAQLATDLKNQKEIAERANAAKSAFLAAASHDLRQPIHALSLYIGALRGLPHSVESKPLIERIEEAIGAMDRLFSALLDISRLEAGVVEVKREAIGIRPFMERIARDFRNDASSKQLDLVVLPSDAIVYTDPLLLERILRNLLSNAIRYTEHGGVLVRCRQCRGGVALQVWDSGRGVPREHHEAIFQEYVQIGNPERDREKGLGLGLAIVRRLTELLDVPVTLRSRVGQGSCFEVWLPIAAARGPDPEALHEEPFRVKSDQLVAVVDDEVSIQDAMAKLLRHWGYRVAVAGSGDELLRVLLPEMGVPALIICDYRLRDAESGAHVVKRVRDAYDRDIPAIFITGDIASERLAEARASGILLLHKPTPNGSLRAAIQNKIAEGRAAMEETP